MPRAQQSSRDPYADRCPSCDRHVATPERSTRLGDEMACRYVCPCGHMWSTRWLVGAVEGWDAADGHVAIGGAVTPTEM